MWTTFNETENKLYNLRYLSNHEKYHPGNLAKYKAKLLEHSIVSYLPMINRVRSVIVLLPKYFPSTRSFVLIQLPNVWKQIYSTTAITVFLNTEQVYIFISTFVMWEVSWSLSHHYTNKTQYSGLRVLFGYDTWISFGHVGQNMQHPVTCRSLDNKTAFLHSTVYRYCTELYSPT